MTSSPTSGVMAAHWSGRVPSTRGGRTLPVGGGRPCRDTARSMITSSGRFAAIWGYQHDEGRRMANSGYKAEGAMDREMSDPAIDEIRAVRHRISARFGHDPERLVAYY